MLLKSNMRFNIQHMQESIDSPMKIADNSHYFL